jgi:serine/threonine protein kinase/tetratricopeptide (TPR) repeat protein
MKPERWQQIERLYYDALEREPDERAAFLESACGSDESLRLEVASLVAAGDSIGSFMEPPDDAIAEETLNNTPQRSMIGELLGRYRTVSLIGKGGMGEVYLAEDTTLGRKVALKLLPAPFTKDQVRLRRFEQEARAASALNHPNIITIHEIGRAHNEDGITHYIVTEYVEGETLRQRIEREPLTLSRALDIALQVASALAAAHDAGIAHRDIKPENLMVRPDGLLKVLDFGLAKLTERGSTFNSKAPTAAQVDTDRGTIMGTVRYMSPEQARGQAVDARTDIFSLGVVLYEVTTGHLPFEGHTPMDMLASILNQEPPPLARYSPAAPAELQRIVSKALRKDREERYQVVKDLLLDLKSLKQELEIDAKLGQTIPAALDREGTRGQVVVQTGRSEASETGDAVRTTSSAEYLVRKIKRHKRGALLAIVTLVMALTGVAYFFIGRTPPIDSIAVLPFVNAGADPESEYLSDGIAESLINSLSQLPTLRVVPRSTVFRYKGQNTDPQEIGRKLGVRAVLTGRVLQRGERLNIQMELIDVTDVAQLWGEQYNRRLADIFSVQEEISREITEKLRLKLTGEERKYLTKRYTENTEAYQLYLKGRYYWNRRTPESLNKGIEYFQQAIEKDPTYALAYTGLADSYSLLGSSIGGLSPRETFPKAKAAALNALERDDTLAEAHAARGLVSLRYDWDWPTAEREIKRAIDLNPNYATTYQWYSDYLVIMRRPSEAIDAIKRAQELDPLSIIINSVMGMRFYHERRYDQAIEQSLEALELDPNFAQTHYFLGLNYEQKTRYEDAIASLKKATTLSPGNLSYVSALGHAYAVSGHRGEAMKILGQLQDLSQHRYVSPHEMALLYAGLDEDDRAFAWLDKAYTDRSWRLVFLKLEPRFDNLHADPRFADLVRRVGLTP